MRFRILLGLAAVAVACSPEATTEANEGIEIAGDQQAVVGSCTEVGLPKFCKYWDAGETITFYWGPTTTRAAWDAVSHAAGGWTTALAGVLAFDMDSASGDIEVKYAVGNGGTDWCGSADPGSDEAPPAWIKLERGTCGTADAVALHELAHLVGFNNPWETPDKNDLKLGSLNHMGHCAVVLQGGAKATQVCQHEIEGVKYVYGERPSAPNFYAHLATGIRAPSPPPPIDVNATAQVGPARLFYRLSNGTRCGLQSWEVCVEDETGTPSFSSSISWSSDNQAVATVARTASGANVTGKSNGTTTIRVSHSLNSVRATRFTNGSMTVQVADVPNPPTGSPSNLAAPTVTHNSAVVTWTNGDPSAHTVVRYRINGTSTWSSVTATPNAVSAQLPNLTPSSTYSVEAHHLKDGLSSPPVSNAALFQTAAGPTLGVTAFWTSACQRVSSGGKLYNRWTERWTGTVPTSGLTYYEIRQSATDNPATATAVRTGKTTGNGSVTIPDFLVSSTPAYRYLWIRFSNGTDVTAWTPLMENPWNMAGACAV